MKALVTGAGGWLGSELTKQLLDKGYKVIALERRSTNSLNSLKNIYKENLEIILGDICDFRFIDDNLRNIDVIYHLAAKVHSIPKTKEEEKEFFKVNTEATKNLFECAIKHNIKRFIFYSSVSVYGESENIITISSPKNPQTAYAKSKFMAEEIGMKLYKENKLPITIIQPVTVYGGNDVGNFEKLRKLINKGFAPRFGDGNNKKTVIYYEDLIKMTIKISEDKKAIGEYIIAGSESLSINEILKILNRDNKAKIIKINNIITNIIINILQLFNLNKLVRQISVLKSNNNFDIKKSEVYLVKQKKFKEYYK